MNIDFLDSVTNSDKGVEFEIKNPKNGQGTHIFFTIKGGDSKAYSEALKLAMKNATKETTIDDVNCAVVISTTMGFSAEEQDADKDGKPAFDKDGNPVYKNVPLMLDGKELRFSEATLRDLFKIAPTIPAQLAIHQKERGDFLKMP